MRCSPFFILVMAYLFSVGCSPSTNGPNDDDDGGSEGACGENGLLDSDNDGIPNQVEGGNDIDTDRDGVPDFLDEDSDNDGFADSIESGRDECTEDALDSDFDGIPDFQDVDSDGNGIPDLEENDQDPDDDGIPNWRDLDDDGDEISDLIEIGPDPTDIADTDSDGTPDYHDIDSDGDTIPDIFEGNEDIDADGRGCFRDTDSDGDGWSDNEEYNPDTEGNPADSDRDGIPDFRELDSDGDQLSDVLERDYGTDRTDVDTDDDTFSDYQEIQAGTDPLNGNDFPVPDPCDPDACLPAELCGEHGSGDGIDNDCNDQVDEICPCNPGETRSCFIGTESERGQGICSDGLLTCDEFGQWSACTGGTWPQAEVCDGADNDCDGLYDEDLSGCESPLRCPGTSDAPPLSTVELEGSDIYDGPFDSWTWEVFCPTTVDPCPLPEDPSAQDTTIYLISSGAYRVRATIINGDETYACEYTIQVQGDGLRVELTWDTQGSAHGDTDVDLHLHRPRTTSNWCTEIDDCYFSNCKSDAWSWGTGLDWGYEHTFDTSACNEAPHGHGAEWEALGFCANPRLDVDLIYCNSAQTDSTADDFCAPENINVDNPELGDTFRIMVNYWSAHSYSGDTHPTVNIYCGGGLRATFGEGTVALRDTGEGCDGENWLVADVTFFMDECGAVDCNIDPIWRDEAPWIQTGTDFGPPW